MSSSKVFREDPHFTPMSLVRESIDLPGEETAVPEVVPAVPPAPPPPAPIEPPMAVEEHAPLPPEPAIDLEAIRQEAYNQGVADQIARFQIDLERTLLAFDQACRKIDKLRRQILDHSRSDLVNVLIALTEKILGQELATPRNVIASTLQTAMEQAIESEEYYVTLHPEDLAFAEAQRPELIAAIRGLERIIFKTDATISRGGCLLESAVCTVDATIEGQLEGVKSLLLDQPDLIPMAVNDEALSVFPAAETEQEAALPDNDLLISSPP
jgi:flagellar assembly protein FliH